VASVVVVAGVDGATEATGTTGVRSCGALDSSDGVLGAGAGVLGSSDGVLGAGAGVLGSSDGVLGAGAGVLGSSDGVLGASDGVLGAGVGSPSSAQPWSWTERPPSLQFLPS